jgi:hypothetical protein
MQSISKPDSAKFYFSLALQQARAQNDLRNEFHVYMAQAKYLANMPPPEKINLLNRALTIAKQTGYLEGQANAALALSNVYDGLAKKDSSLYFYRIHRLAFDTLFSEQNKRNTIIRESEWMLKRKEIENQHLKQLSSIQEKELGIKNALLWVLFVCFRSHYWSSHFLLPNLSRQKRQEQNLLSNKRSRKRKCRHCNHK